MKTRRYPSETWTLREVPLDGPRARQARQIARQAERAREWREQAA